MKGTTLTVLFSFLVIGIVFSVPLNVFYNDMRTDSGPLADRYRITDNKNSENLLLFQENNQAYIQGILSLLFKMIA